MERNQEPSYEHLTEEQWQDIAPLLSKMIKGYEDAHDTSLRELWSVMIPSNRAVFLRAATDKEFADQLKKIKKDPER